MQRKLWTCVCLIAVMASGFCAAATGNTHPDFSGTWQTADAATVVSLTLTDFDPQYKPLIGTVANATPPPARPTLTPFAKQRIDNFVSHFDVRGKDDQGKQCVMGGLPWLMTALVPYPIEIAQSAKRMTMFFELHDRRRVIYFGLKNPPEEIFPSTEGFSIGHWEGKTLVIDTTKLKASSEFSMRQRSEKMHIIERWTFVKDVEQGDTINIDITVEDKDIFSPPFHARQRYKRTEPNTWVGEYSCMDALWEDNIAKRKIELEKK